MLWFLPFAFAVLDKARVVKDPLESCTLKRPKNVVTWRVQGAEMLRDAEMMSLMCACSAGFGCDSERPATYLLPLEHASYHVHYQTPRKIPTPLMNHIRHLCIPGNLPKKFGGLTYTVSKAISDTAQKMLG